MIKALGFWVIGAAYFGFLWMIGLTAWRLYTGNRTPFGEIWSHWDFKNGFILVLIFPFIIAYHAWRAITSQEGWRVYMVRAFPRPSWNNIFKKGGRNRGRQHF